MVQKRHSRILFAVIDVVEFFKKALHCPGRNVTADYNVLERSRSQPAPAEQPIDGNKPLLVKAMSLRLTHTLYGGAIMLVHCSTACDV